MLFLLCTAYIIVLKWLNKAHEKEQQTTPSQMGGDYGITQTQPWMWKENENSHSQFSLSLCLLQSKIDIFIVENRERKRSKKVHYFKSRSFALRGEYNENATEKEENDS